MVLHLTTLFLHPLIECSHMCAHVLPRTQQPYPLLFFWSKRLANHSFVPYWKSYYYFFVILLQPGVKGSLEVPSGLGQDSNPRPYDPQTDAMTICQGDPLTISSQVTKAWESWIQWLSRLATHLFNILWTFGNVGPVVVYTWVHFFHRQDSNKRLAKQCYENTFFWLEFFCLNFAMTRGQRLPGGPEFEPTTVWSPASCHLIHFLCWQIRKVI